VYGDSEPPLGHDAQVQHVLRDELVGGRAWQGSVLAGQEREAGALFRRCNDVLLNEGLFVGADPEHFGGGPAGQQVISNGRAVIYMNTRSGVDVMYTMLPRLAQQKGGPIADVKWYRLHAGMPMEEREGVLQQFLRDEGRWKFIVATVALGAGVDPGHVRLVLHWGAFGHAVFYQQESGRAGRDGHRALARIYTTPYSLQQLESVCRGDVHLATFQEMDPTLQPEALQASTHACPHHDPP
jgi:superfamily II DNA/RNA helicase